ncbi:hypothetical protein ACP4OV_025632 [Aristida adscensionis]
MANNATPPAHHGKSLSKTSSRSVTACVSGTHDFVVSGFSLLDGLGIGRFVSSSTFEVDGYDWNINFFPDGSKTEDEAVYASAYLDLLSGKAGVRVKFSLCLLGKDGEVAELRKETYTFEPSGDSSNWGWHKFIKKSKLQEVSRLNGDGFTIRCVLTVIKDPRTEDVSTIVVPQSNLHQHLECMLKDGKGIDVAFIVDGQLFHGHRCVLAARSPVFEAELLGPLRKKPVEHIKIHDIEPSIFEALLHFIYTDSLPENCNADETIVAQHLLVAADRYGVHRLKLICEDKLCRGMDVQTVANTLALADQHHCLQLKEACLRFIISQDMLAAVMDTDGFRHLLTSCPSITKDISSKVAAMKREQPR